MTVMIKNNIPKIKGLALPPLRRNWDYEVISHSIWDREANEYYSLEEVKHMDQSKLSICEDDIPEWGLIGYNYETDINNSINIYNAKQFDFGVLRLMKEGENKGKEFLFPLLDINIPLQLFMYAYTTHGYVDQNVLKEIKSSEKFRHGLKYVCRDYLDEVMEMVDDL